MYLSREDQEVFSFNELAVIEIIGKRTMTLKEIAEELYDGVRSPKYASTAVSSLVSRINMKAHKYRLNFRINLGGSSGGRVPKDVSIKKK